MRSVFHPLRVSIIFIFFLFCSVYCLAQKDFTNQYGRLNADRTLRLEYIEHTESSTRLYVSYLGTTNRGSYTGLYLNNLRIVDRNTKAEYRPVDTGLLPTTTDGKFFVYNSGSIIVLEIKFRRLPSYVTDIDVIEGDGSVTATYNFTFKNLGIDPELDFYDDLEDFLYENESYAATIFSVFDAQIDIYIDDVYVAKLDRKFNSATYTPACGEYGTITILFSNDNERSGKGKGSSGGKNYNWNFNFTPKSTYFGDCHKHRLK